MGSISSTVLVQVKGRQRSFRTSMNVLIAVTNSMTLAKVPRRMACRVMIPKNTSTRFSPDQEVGVKCYVIRGLRASHTLMSTCLWV
jgi:hypothetical protein